MIVAILGFPSINASSPNEHPTLSLAISTKPGSTKSWEFTKFPSLKRPNSSSSYFFLTISYFYGIFTNAPWLVYVEILSSSISAFSCNIPLI